MDPEKDDDGSSTVTSLRSMNSVIASFAKIRTFIIIREEKDSSLCL